MQTGIQPNNEGGGAIKIEPTNLPDAALGKIAEPKPEHYNPYLIARREWDERHGDLRARAMRADRIALISAAIALVETIALVVIVLRPPKVVVVGVNSLGQYLGSGTSGQSFVVSEEMKRSALSDWVSNLRMVTPDAISQRWAIEKVYAMMSSGSAAQTVVSDYYRREPPPTRAQTQTVHVDVNTVLTASGKTYEVEWLETVRDLQGKILSEQRYKGAFTFVIGLRPPSDERLARLNPIGVYITEANWTRIL